MARVLGRPHGNPKSTRELTLVVRHGFALLQKKRSLSPMIRVLAGAAVILAGQAGLAMAAPTMIRLGYRDCASCHVSRQGGGLLTPYGKGVDEAQSLRAREIPQPEGPGPRLLYDVR